MVIFKTKIFTESFDSYCVCKHYSKLQNFETKLCVYKQTYFKSSKNKFLNKNQYLHK